MQGVVGNVVGYHRSLSYNYSCNVMGKMLNSGLRAQGTLAWCRVTKLRLPSEYLLVKSKLQAIARTFKC